MLQNLSNRNYSQVGKVPASFHGKAGWQLLPHLQGVFAAGKI
jgi:hypothetical protein